MACSSFRIIHIMWLPEWLPFVHRNVFFARICEFSTGCGEGHQCPLDTFLVVHVVFFLEWMCLYVLNKFRQTYRYINTRFVVCSVVCLFPWVAYIAKTMDSDQTAESKGAVWSGFIVFCFHEMGRDLSSGVFEQHRRRPACASPLFEQRLCYSVFGKYHM